VTTANPEELDRRRGPLAPLLSALDVARRASSGVKHALDRPLASYYLLLGASALLLTIGLIMVLSSSSVRAFEYYDDSYALVKRQLLWVVIGIPAAWVASRLPYRAIRRLAYPAT
jgi:cell division protein FtsW